MCYHRGKLTRILSERRRVMRTRYLLMRFLRSFAVGYGVGTAFGLLLLAAACAVLKLAMR